MAHEEASGGPTGRGVADGRLQQRRRGVGRGRHGPTDPANLTGEITVLTNRTDLVTDGTLDRYAAEFRKMYPKVTVKFEGITDYEGEVKIRMNSDDYGDVLLIPQLGYRRPTTRSSSSRSATQASSQDSTAFIDYGHRVNGKVYGIASTGNAHGLRLQQEGLEAGRDHRAADDAGASSWTALQAIKAKPA